MHLARRLIGIMILAQILLGCKSNSKTINEKRTKGKSDELEKTAEIGEIKMSPRAKIFYKKLNEDKSQNNNAKPSKELIYDYKLKEIDGNFYISGFITVNENFSIESIQEIGVKPGTHTDTKISVLVNLNTIDKFIKIRGITYFDIAEKVDLK